MAESLSSNSMKGKRGIFYFFSEIWWFDFIQLFSFSYHNISSSDLEERDENQEIEKAKVSGGRSVSGSFILLI